MSLDQDSAGLVARLHEIKAPRYETFTPDEARAAMAASRKAAALVPPPIYAVRDIAMAGVHGDVIQARLYMPCDAAGLPLLVFFHGGGFVLGDLDSHDILCRRLAIASDCAVLAVDYRLAPEHKFPAAVDDAIASVEWVLAHAAELGIDGTRIGLGGDSAGANLATVVALHRKRSGLPHQACQVLLYPVTDLRCELPSHQIALDGLPVVGDTMVWFRDHYLASPQQRADWRASPLRAEDVTGLPPAFVLTAGYDPLMDEGRAYAGKLREAGVAVTEKHYAGQLHGFLTMGARFPTTEAAIAEIASFMREELR